MAWGCFEEVRGLCFWGDQCYAWGQEDSFKNWNEHFWEGNVSRVYNNKNVLKSLKGLKARYDFSMEQSYFSSPSIPSEQWLIQIAQNWLATHGHLLVEKKQGNFLGVF